MSISPISGESQYITNLQIRSIANSPIEVRSCEMQWLQVFRNLGHIGVWSRINAWGKSTVTFWGFKHLQTVFKAVDFEASLADQHQKKAYSAPQGITFLYSNSQDGMIHKDLWSLQHFKAFPWRKGWKMKEQGEPTAPPDSCFGQPATNRKRWCGWFALLHSASIGERRPAPLFWCWFSIDLFAKCNWLSHILQLQRFLHDGEANRSAKHGATNILHTATTSPCWQSVDLTNLVSVPDIHD